MCNANKIKIAVNKGKEVWKITQCNKVWVMSCPWGFDCRTSFVGYQTTVIRLGLGEFFFLKSELFRCEKVQKGLIQPGRHLRNGFGLQLFLVLLIAIKLVI